MGIILGSSTELNEVPLDPPVGFYPGSWLQNWLMIGSKVSRGGSRKSLRVVLLVGEAHLRRSGLVRNRGSLGGSGGMPPQKIFGNMDALRCNLAHS